MHYFLKICILADKKHENVEFTIYDSGDIFYKNDEGLIALNFTIMNL